MRIETGLSNALPVSAAEEFGPLFADLDEVPHRRVVDLELQEDLECVRWHLVAELDGGIILRDGIEYWMEETLWTSAMPHSVRGFALRYKGVEFEFSQILARRTALRQPDTGRNSKRSQGRRAVA